MARRSPFDDWAALERARFLDWLYNNPNATPSQYRTSRAPTQRTARPYLPPDPLELARQNEPQLRRRRPPAPDIHLIARMSHDPSNPWTWTDDLRPETERIEIWRYRLLELRDAGLITYDGGEDPRVNLTSVGMAEAEARRVERDVRQRWRQQAAAANGLLRWLSEQDLHGEQWSRIDGVLTSRHAVFEGEHLPESLFRRAADYLEAQKLIRGDTGTAEIRGPLTAQITYRGQECLQSGGDVNEYLQRLGDRATHNHGPVVHGGISGSQLAWDNQSVTQNYSTNQQIAPGYEALAESIADVLRHLPTMELSPEAQEDAESAGNEVLAEITRDEPRPGPIRRSLTVIRGALAAVAAGSVGGAAAGVSDGAQEAARNAIERLASF